MADDFAGGASAPADTSAVSDTQADVSLPNPVRTDPMPDPKPAEDKKPADDGKNTEPKKEPVSARDAIKKAMAKVAEKDSADKTEAALKNAPKTAEKPTADATKTKEAAAEPNKADATPKPAGQTQPDQAKDSPTRTPPSRFSDDAKAAWEAAPESVRGEVHRAIKELEQGHQKYKADAEAFHNIREFDDLAKKHGTTIRDAMTQYTNLERTLLSEPLKGIQAVCDYAGVDLRQLAAHVLGQKPEQVQSQQDATIRELRQQVSQLAQQVGGVSTTMQQQKLASIDEEVNAFAGKNPRFEELTDDIAFFLQTKRATDLQEAYDMADRLNPAPNAPARTAPVAAKTPDLDAQTVKGSKSVSGAPGPGSDPADRPRSTSIKDSIRRAMAQVG